MQDIYKDFTEEGYALFPSQIPEKEIDDLLIQLSN